MWIHNSVFGRYSLVAIWIIRMSVLFNLKIYIGLFKPIKLAINSCVIDSGWLLCVVVLRSIWGCLLATQNTWDCWFYNAHSLWTLTYWSRCNGRFIFSFEQRIKFLINFLLKYSLKESWSCSLTSHEFKSLFWIIFASNHLSPKFDLRWIVTPSDHFLLKYGS